MKQLFSRLVVILTLSLLLPGNSESHRHSKHNHGKSKYHRKLHSGNPIVSTMNAWQNPNSNPLYGQQAQDPSSNLPQQQSFGANGQNMDNMQNPMPMNPTMMHPSMSGMMSPFMMNSMMPQKNPYMLGMYGSYHPGNMLHPLHPFNPYNTYAGMAFNPMMTGPYGFGGATYMDSYIDGLDDGKLLI